MPRYSDFIGPRKPQPKTYTAEEEALRAPMWDPAWDTMLALTMGPEYAANMMLQQGIMSGALSGRPEAQDWQNRYGQYFVTPPGFSGQNVEKGIADFGDWSRKRLPP